MSLYTESFALRRFAEKECGKMRLAIG
jgi:hypothetical protein